MTAFGATMPATGIADPRSAPVISKDHHLPALEAALLTPQALARRFASAGGWQPEFSGDGLVIAGKPATSAAVLVPLLFRDEGEGRELGVLLTRRASHLRQHAGQISFPGGRAEAADAGPAATALREAQEEVGLPPGRVQIIGQLPAYRTITNFSVVPVVGLVRAPFETALDRNEADEAFEVPLSFLMNPAHHCHHAIHVDGRLREFLSISWQSQVDDGVRREYFIWGATAAMLRNLYRFLAG